MSRFINSTLVDMRKGRESWRVFIAVCGPAFVVTVIGLILQNLV